ncbi:hypothetical protein F4802DRAFT_415237 [Xylaria palmicola]|nr:hypothetical protein F4802DRAFT_415237 [Xylaria palmicola]
MVTLVIGIAAIIVFLADCRAACYALLIVAWALVHFSGGCQRALWQATTELREWRFRLTGTCGGVVLSSRALSLMLSLVRDGG